MDINFARWGKATLESSQICQRISLKLQDDSPHGFTVETWEKEDIKNSQEILEKVWYAANHWSLNEEDPDTTQTYFAFFYMLDDEEDPAPKILRFSFKIKSPQPANQRVTFPMNKIEFELHAILACLQDGKGIASAQAKAQEAVDAMTERNYFGFQGVPVEGEHLPKRYEGPVNHGPGAAMAPPAPVATQGGGNVKQPGGQIVQAGGSRGSGQTRIVDMTGGNRQPEGRSTGTSRGPSQGRSVAPPVVVKVGQGKPGEGVRS